MINDDFNDFEDIIKVKITDRDFLLSYHWKVMTYLRKLFYAKKKTFCCFLYHVYIYSTQLLAHHTTRTFYVEDIIDNLVVQKLNKLKEDFYEKKN